MRGKPQDCMIVGLIHFMAYPETMKGEGPVVETLEAVCRDNYFGAVEVTHVSDPKARAEAAAMAREAGMKVAFGAQPILLSGGLNLNAADPLERRKAVDAARRAVDEAVEWGACGVAVLSGKDPGPDARNEERAYLVASLKELCEHSRQQQGPPVLLEVFDRVEYGKNCLVGPTAEATAIARQVTPYFPSFGLMIDLSHLPLLGETPEQAVKAAGKALKHAHLGNCVMRSPDHPAYGDNHPMFGIPDGENGVAELVAFLIALLDAGFIAQGSGSIVSFEVKPFGGQSSEEVIANSKETLNAAWAAL